MAVSHIAAAVDDDHMAVRKVRGRSAGTAVEVQLHLLA
jgi:hypothetical protein